MVITLIVMASPVGNVVQHNIEDVTTSFGNKASGSSIDDSNPFVKNPTNGETSADTSKAENKDSTDTSADKDANKEEDKNSSDGSSVTIPDNDTPTVATKTASQKAKEISDTLLAKVSEGSLKLNCGNNEGAWVILVKNTNKTPSNYGKDKFQNNRFYGANNGVEINGKKVSKSDWFDWNRYEEGSQKLFASMDLSFLQEILESSDNMDWIEIQVYKSGSEAKVRFLSGMKGGATSISDNKKETAIETYLKNN